MVESKDRKANAHLILKLMCDSVVLRPHLRELLSAKYVSLKKKKINKSLLPLIVFHRFLTLFVVV